LVLEVFAVCFCACLVACDVVADLAADEVVPVCGAVVVPLVACADVVLAPSGMVSFWLM